MVFLGLLGTPSRDLHICEDMRVGSRGKPGQAEETGRASQGEGKAKASGSLKKPGACEVWARDIKNRPEDKVT